MATDDRELIAAAQRGDQGAFRTLVERYQRRCFAVAVGVLHNHDDANDVCQEAFMKAYRNLGTFEGDAQFFTWMYRIVMNLCIDYLRKRRGEKLEFDETVDPGERASDATGISPQRLGFDPQRALTDKELRAHIWRALEELSPTHRAVLVMREIEGLSYQDMADRMKCSIGTIMSRLFHARKRMQKMLLQFRVAA